MKIAVGAFAALVTAVLGASVAVPSPSGPVAVLAAPWASRSPILMIVAAGGRLVAGGADDRVAVGYAPDAGFIGRLYAAGALLVFDPVLATNCLHIR